MNNESKNGTKTLAEQSNNTRLEKAQQKARKVKQKLNAVRQKKAEGGSDAPEKAKKKDMVAVTLPDGSKRKVFRGARAGFVLEQSGLSTPFPIVAARFRNKICSLERAIEQDGTLAPVHLGQRDGTLIYRRSVSFVLIRAVTELFAGLRTYINHSVDQGYYCEVYNEQYQANTAVALSESDIRNIEKRMREIVEADETISRNEYPVEEAIEVFRKAGMNDKVELLKYSPAGPVSVYSMGNSINHFYGQLAPSTGCLKNFELVPLAPGFVLRFPRANRPNEMPPFVHQEKISGALLEYEKWMRILEWRTVPQLNRLVDEGRVREYVLIAEALHEKKLATIADKIKTHPRQPRIILLSGPSASGKTTTVKRLAIQLRVNGYRPVVIGLDDFFVDRDKTPKDEKGDYDFESFDAIDVVRLQQCVNDLISGKTVQLPKFSFQAGRSFPGEEMHLEKDQILILEGIHGLNDRLLPTIPDGLKFKIYASPLTHLNIDDHNRISSSDARLLRRIVRDYNYRGYGALQTLQRWPSVRRGEEKNIFPYQENADVVFNSALPYEFSILKPYALTVLKHVNRKESEFSEAARLIKFLSYFRQIDADFVPRHSLLREFIGGSCFTY